MGLPPERVLTLMLAQEKRLGHVTDDKIPQLGEAVASLATRFELPPQIEKHLLPVPAPGAVAS
jgi:hypothetical protein